MINNNTLNIDAPDAQRKFRLSPAALTLLGCFAVPFLAMIVIYCSILVWPVGEHSVLVLDLNAQYIYYLEELREIIVNGDSIIYSFNRNLGGEFLGIFAYYLSSPFSMIIALFPEDMITEAVYLILVLKAGFCGLTFGFYLQKTRKMHPSQTIMFSAMYALSSYAVVMQHNLMWTDNIIAFPLILYAVDRLICRGKLKMYVIVLVYCIMSNFYIGYQTCFFVLIWFFIRYFMLSPEERNPDNVDYHFGKSFLRIGIASIVAAMISAIILLPVYYSLSFGKLGFSIPDYTPTQLFDFLDLLTKTFFGSYDTVRPEGMPFLYCGTLALILAPLYFFSKKIPTRRKIGFALIMIVLILGFNFNVADLIWHGLQKPNWLNARFAFMFAGVMIIMAADVLRNINDIGAKAVMTSSILWCVLLLILDKLEYENLPDFSAVWASILLFIVFAAAIPIYIKHTPDRVKQKTASIVLCCIVLVEVIGNGVLMAYGLDKDVYFSTRDSYRNSVDKYVTAAETFTEDDDTFYRAEKLVHRSRNDIMAINLNGLTNSTSTLNARVIKLLGQFGFAARAHWSYYSGETAPTDALFGVKYLMIDRNNSLTPPSYINDLYELYASTEDGIDVYKNPYSLSIAFSAKADALNYDLAPVLTEEEKEKEKEKKTTTTVSEDYTDPFTYMNELYSALLGREVNIWIPARLADTSTANCKRVSTIGHNGYTPDGSGNTTKVIFTVGIDGEKPLYVYFPSDYPRKATLYLNGVKLGNYFDSKDFAITELGTYDDGDQVKVELWLTTTALYIRKNVNYFWYFDEEAYLDAVTELQAGAMTAYSEADHYVYGTVNVKEGDSIMFTSIPYDKGWEIKVDGETVESIPVLNDTLLAFNITPGEHTIEFTYKPDCIKYGLLLSFAGLAIFCAYCIITHHEKKKRIAQGTYVTPVFEHPDCSCADSDCLRLLDEPDEECDLPDEQEDALYNEITEIPSEDNDND